MLLKPSSVRLELEAIATLNAATEKSVRELPYLVCGFAVGLANQAEHDVLEPVS